MTRLEKLLQNALDKDDNSQVAEIKNTGDLDVIISIPRWIVLGYLLYRVQQEGKWTGTGMPSKSVKLAKALADIEK